MPKESNEANQSNEANPANPASATCAGKHPAPPCTLVIFGAGGDLTKRLLMPSLYNLSADKLLDDGMEIIGVNHGERETSDWRDELTQSLRGFAADKAATFHTSQLNEEAWNWVVGRLEYFPGEFEEDETFARLKARLAKAKSGNIMFYLAVGARFFQPIIEHLGAAGLLEEKDGNFRRLVIEKPFGTDLASAKALNACILKFADESQVYRIDHFLGKDTVQSILAVRFANAMFEPIWRREYIDNVQITAAETIGVEGRGKFYEQTGAFRDMLPNHLFQLLGMVAMEPPNSFDAESVRDRKAEIFDAIRPLTANDVVLGQYEAGPAGPGYKEEPGVAKDSSTETYAAARVYVENWRWAGVPFYLRTGKRLARKVTEIAVTLKPVPHLAFQSTGSVGVQANQIVLTVQPDEGVSVSLGAKIPGSRLRIRPVNMEFRYGTSFMSESPEAYERLILDAMRGDATLFTRNDEIEALWGIIDPILTAWHEDTSSPVPQYASGSAGPEEANLLLAEGQRWRRL
jgi:glucose-6-phosphate 1-dehydrogenase